MATFFNFMRDTGIAFISEVLHGKKDGRIDQALKLQATQAKSLVIQSPLAAKSAAGSALTQRINKSKHTIF